MREAHARSAGDKDWGIHPYGSRDVWRELLDAHSAVLDHYIRHPLDGFRLRRILKHARGPLRVSLGCGRNVEAGWIGLDLSRGPSIYSGDLRKVLPFETGTIDSLLAEHVVEHLLFDDIPRLFGECIRVMRSGAVLRVVSPDALLVGELLVEGGVRSDAHLAFEKSIHGWLADSLLPLRTVNRIAYQWGQHQSLLTADGVADMLLRSGFRDIEKISPSESRHFTSIPGTHLKRFPESANEAFAVEAIRP